MKTPPLLIRDLTQNVEKLKALLPTKKHFDEAWLQKLLFLNPDLLPAAEIDSNYHKLIPIGREIPVTSGFIDVLYATPQGRLCIVETKLWRNPEAHRTVLAQILDYAKDLSIMEFKELQAKTIKSFEARGEKFKSIFEAVKDPYLLDIDEFAFEEAMMRSLRTGDFLLLIVGDLIRPEVLLLTEIVQAAPHLEFSLGLIELDFYHPVTQDWPLMIVPSVVGRTHEVIRSVVKILYEEKKPEVVVTAVEEDSNLSKGKINLETFIQSLPTRLEDVFRVYLEKWLSGPFYVYWGKVGFSLRLKKDDKFRTIIDAYPEYISIFKKEWLEDWCNPVATYQQYYQRMEKIPAVTKVITLGKRYVYYKDLSPEDLDLFLQATDNLAQALAN